MRQLEWPHYAHDAGGTRYSPLEQVNRQNVGTLERAWTYRTGDIAEGSAHYTECTPIVTGGVIYIITPFSRLIAIDALSGKELWRFTPDPPLDLKETGGGGLASRGVTYWEGNGKQRIFLPVRDGRLYSVDVTSHAADPSFGHGGYINLRDGLARGGKYLFLSSPPATYQNVLIQPYGISDSGTELLGYVPLRAYDTESGALLWTFDTVPQPGQFGNDTWGGESWKDRAGCNPWAPIAVDEERGIFYASVGAPNADKYGGDRPGDNLFSNALVALDALSGKRLWHFQTVHHDIWDYDLPAQPNLFEVWRDGLAIPAVAVVGKTGFVYAFNRVTGEPLFPIEERPVPPSDFAGEHASPTQPIPVRPPPFARQRITADDISALNPDTHRELLETFHQLRSEGIFTPPSERGTVVLPGQHGGGNWSGAAVSPEGMLYVAATELPYISSIQRNDNPYGATASARRWFDRNGYPAVKPPWGTLTKLDLSQGELVWQRPLGEFSALRAQGIPITGQNNFGGTTVTAEGLVLVAGTQDEHFRIFNAENGDLLFETELEAACYGAPVTYLGADGAQYIALFAGGGGKYSSPSGDYVVAYRLGG